jgi:hypothetical protein
VASSVPLRKRPEKAKAGSAVAGLKPGLRQGYCLLKNFYMNSIA